MDYLNDTCIKHDIFHFPKKQFLGKLTKLSNSSCQYVMLLPYSERCDFVKTNKDCGADGNVLINTFHLVFCNFSEEYSFIGLILTVLNMIIAFVTTAFIADGFICTNLAVISRSLHLPDSIAGVSLLALGNGIPDLFSAYAGAELSHPEILFGGMTGAALFDVSMAAGWVIFVRPFYIETYSWWTLIFFLCNYSILFTGFYFRNFTMWHSVAMIVIYGIYGLFTVAHFAIGRFAIDESIDTTPEENEIKLIQMARNKTFAVPEGKYREGTVLNTVEVLKAIERARIYRNMGYRLSARRSADYGYSWRHPKQMFRELMDSLDFTRDYDWRVGSTLARLLIIIQLPWNIGLKLLLPAVVPNIKVNDGWCKLMVMINSFIYPYLIIYCFSFEEVAIGPIKLWHIALPLGIVLALIIFFSTRTNQNPKFHTVFAYAGFIGSIAMYRILSTQIILSLQTIGARLSLSSSWLALTVLAWGNSVTDIVSATSLSKQGMQNMGYSSLYGGPMFSIL